MNPIKVRVQVKIKNISAWANHKNYLTLLRVINISSQMNSFPLKFSSLKQIQLNGHDIKHSSYSSLQFKILLKKSKILMERIQCTNSSNQCINTSNLWRNTPKQLISMEYTMLKTMGLIRGLWMGMEWGWKSMGRVNLGNSKQLSNIGQIAIPALENVNVHPSMIPKIHSNV